MGLSVSTGYGGTKAGCSLRALAAHCVLKPGVSASKDLADSRAPEREQSSGALCRRGRHAVIRHLANRLDG